ncbi:MAG: single-stranded DNA-binding protein [Bacteroidales bacterium]|nr:single-stranded DNA-binding protein [Bacteroidales bacterium]
MYLNKVMLIGRLGVKPEIRYVKEDTPVATFRMATTEPYRTKEGEKREITEWHNIVAWRNLAKFCETYLDKGMLIYLEGRLQTRSWQAQDNTTRYTTEILADVIRMMEPKSARDGQQVTQSEPLSQPADAQPFAEQPAQTQAAAEPNAFQPAAEPEDDLPF